MNRHRRYFGRAALAGLAAVAGLAVGPTLARAQEIKIGFSMALTGGLGVNGKSALMAMQLWEEDINKQGGLLGRQVKLIYYDDQSNPSTIPGIYTKLLDVDKVDLVVGGYATAMLAPALPIVMQRNKLFLGLYGLAVNSEFHYPKYFAMIPSGPNPKPSFTRGFFNIAMAQNPKPQTVAIVAADQEFSKNAADGARDNAKAAGLRIVYDRSYPSNITDCAPVIRAIQATNPDLVVLASYPADSACLLRAASEIGLKPRMMGGAMVGLQATAIKMQFGPLLNGIVNYDFWLPAPTMMFPGVEDVLKRYQAKAAAAGVDVLGYYMVPASYAYLQVLGDAVKAVGSLDQDKLADYIRKTTFKTVWGDIRFGGTDGEWAEPRVLQVQFQGITGKEISQFTDPTKTVILDPPNFKSGTVIYPYEQATR